MADNSNKNNKKSYFDYVLAGMGLGTAGAAGYASYRYFQNNDPVVGKPRIIPGNPIMESLRRSQDMGPLWAYQRHKTFNFLDRLRSYNYTPDDYRVFQREWESARSSVLPNKMMIPDLDLSESPIATLRTFMAQNESPYVADVFNRFASNIRSLRPEGAMQLSLDPFLSVDTPMPSLTGRSLLDFADTGLGDILGELQAEIGPLSVYRRGEAGQGVLEIARQGKGKLFEIPEAFAISDQGLAGAIRSGQNLENLYTPGLFAITDEAGHLQALQTYSEFKARRILSAVKKQQAGELSGSIESVIRSTATEVEKLQRWTQPMGPGVDYTLESLSRANQILPITAEGEQLRGSALRQFVLQNEEQFRGRLNPASGGRFTLLDEQYLYGPFAKSVPHARKPFQILRDYTPTPEAQAAIEASEFGGTDFDFLEPEMARSRFGGPAGPRLKTLYLSDEQLHGLKELGFPMQFGDGEMLINNSMARQSQVSKSRRIRLTEINKNIADQILSGGVKLENLADPTSLAGPISFGPNTVFGRSVEGTIATAGREITSGEITGIAPASISGGKYTALDLFVKEVETPVGAEKRFGHKAMAQTVDFSWLSKQRQLQEITGLSADELSGFGAIARLADIEKDPSKIRMQQFSQLMAQASPEFRSRSSELLQELGQIRDQKAFGTRLDELAIEAGLTSGQRATIFGRTARQGISSLVYGGPKSMTGAGNLGSLDPRLLTLLSGTYGEFGEELASDLAGRVAAENIEAGRVQTALQKTIRSMTGELVPGETDAVYGANVKGPQLEQLKRQGGFLATGLDEMPHIYMPGYDEVPSMKPRSVGGGIASQASPVADIFKNLRSDLQAYSTGSINQAALEAALTEGPQGYFNQLMRQIAPAGKGAGSLLRGSIPGSVSLTAMSEAPTVAGRPSDFYPRVRQMDLPDPTRIVGISKQHGLRMIEGLEALYGVDEVADVRERFMSGEAIAGMVSRHPNIGPYSAQPALMMAVDTPGEIMILPEDFMTVNGQQLSVGMATGMAADKDADTINAIGFNSKMEKEVRAQLMDANSALSQQMKEYTDHSIRMQLMKVKKGATSTTLTSPAEELAAAATQLRITDDEVGLISSQLTRARTAVTSSTLAAQDKQAALGLLEWLEQQPISGKHLDVANILSGQFEEQLQTVKYGVRSSPEILENTIRSMVDTSNPLAAAMLDEGAEVNGRFLRGWEVKKRSQQIVQSLQQFEGPSPGIQQGSLMRAVAPGPSQTFNMADAADILDAIDANKTGKMSQVVQDTLASANRSLAAVDDAVRPFVKPALIGLGVLAAGSLLFSGPPGVMEAPSSQPPRESEPMPPEALEQNLGSPSVSPQISNRAVNMDDNQMKRSKQIRAKIRADRMTQKQREMLQARLANLPNSQVSVRVQDDRRSLSQTRISDMLD